MKKLCWFDDDMEYAYGYVDAFDSLEEFYKEVNKLSNIETGYGVAFRRDVKVENFMIPKDTLISGRLYKLSEAKLVSLYVLNVENLKHWFEDGVLKDYVVDGKRPFNHKWYTKDGTIVDAPIKEGEII